MRLSRAKINHLSSIVVEALQEDSRVKLVGQPNDVRLEVVRIIREEMHRDEMIDAQVRAKINTQKRDIPEGGREWEVLYRQYYQEEMDKHRPPRE